MASLRFCFAQRAHSAQGINAAVRTAICLAVDLNLSGSINKGEYENIELSEAMVAKAKVRILALHSLLNKNKPTQFDSYSHLLRSTLRSRRRAFYPIAAVRTTKRGRTRIAIAGE